MEELVKEEKIYHLTFHFPHAVVEIESNGFQGGDAGHGGFLSVEIVSCDLDIHSQHDASRGSNTIMAKGDLEIAFILETLPNALKEIQTRIQQDEP